jgi:hypothetical protein
MAARTLMAMPLAKKGDVRYFPTPLQMVLDEKA